jgi:hypothetical protein
MQIAGRRFHIAGSASTSAAPELLRYSHDLVAEIVEALLSAGGVLTVGVGNEPLHTPRDPTSPSLIFDWTVLERVRSHLPAACTGQRVGVPLIATVAGSKTETQIPEHRRALWNTLKRSGVVTLEFLDAGWASGAVRRQRLSRFADLLLVISGGEGVEHLAQVYAEAGKPIIPLDLDLGGITGDGAGGAAMLHRRALVAPRDFMPTIDPVRASLLLAETRTERGLRPIPDVVSAIVSLVGELVPPTVFCVRLLNPAVDGYAAVEEYFRQVVDPVVTDLGYQVFESGRGRNEYAWVNQEIFEGLHFSQAAVVDVTGLRNNCFMELGYALGRALPVILIARAGTVVPFDSMMLPHHFWDETGDNASRREALRDFWLRHINRPPIVSPRRVL